MVVHQEVLYFITNDFHKNLVPDSKLSQDKKEQQA